jgi:hypothetical protein
MADAGIATHRLKKNALGTGAITFLVVSAAGRRRWRRSLA